ncbi:hypothetical protein ABTC40_22855, partial [Acinetobacter baumannii]
RLARFGLEYLKAYLEAFGARLVVLNGEVDQEHPEDLQRELAEDLVAIVSSFAARVYGKRGSVSRMRAGRKRRPPAE